MRNRFLNYLQVGVSLSRNCMKRQAQKELVDARFYFYLLPKAHPFVGSSILGNLFSSHIELVWRHDNENVWVSPMWPGFDSQTCRCVYVDCLIDLHFRGFFSKFIGFLLSLRNITLNSNSAYWHYIHVFCQKYTSVKISFLSLCSNSDCNKKKRSTWWVDNSLHTVRKYTRIFFKELSRTQVRFCKSMPHKKGFHYRWPRWKHVPKVIWGFQTHCSMKTFLN